MDNLQKIWGDSFKGGPAFRQVWERHLWRRVKRHRRRRVAAAMIAAVALGSGGLVAWNTLGQGLHSPTRTRPVPPADTPASLFIPGTDVPAPPAEFRFDLGKDVSAVLRVSAADVHLFASASDGDPDELAEMAAGLLGFYRDRMVALGWTLAYDGALESKTDIGYPEGSVGGGQQWTNGVEGVVIHVGTWWPYEPGGAWRLNLLVSIGPEAVGTDDPE